MESCRGYCIPNKLVKFKLRKISFKKQLKISDAGVRESQFNVQVVSLLIGALEEWKKLQVVKLKTGEFCFVVLFIIQGANHPVCK